jgi:hypothetical protein
MKTTQQVKAFLNTQVKNIKGTEGFVMSLVSKFSNIDSLADTIATEVLPNDPSDALVAFAFAVGSEDSDVSHCLLCTASGIHVIQDLNNGVFDYLYQISFSEIQTIEVKKTGFFEPVYHLNIYQSGKNKKKGWFFTGLPKMLNYFQVSAENALLNYDEDEMSDGSAAAISVVDPIDGAKRIKALLDQKLITKKDFDSKMKKLSQ